MPLRLKLLELQGYKTFASKTVFEFAGGITAIVGPNGSGKSNIADALRWVLGEQSYALLRGKKTEDMIFNGSERRARAGMASAHIVFDNAEGWLPIDFTEVEMTRRAHRDGHNEYLLNNQQVRLRDLNELLAASGLSERTYTILGQGLVDASLALKADERRRLFEEAAGVGLYRVRREEALKRLETTTRNLERVLDIMSELEPRLRSLERQAKRAIEYARAQADLKVILREWYGYHWNRAQQELTSAREVSKAQDERVVESREAHQKTQLRYNEFREKFIGLRSQLNGWHRGIAELHSRREEVSRELAVLEERRRSLLALQTSALNERERVTDEEKTIRTRAEEAEEELTQLENEYIEAQKQQGDAQLKLRSGQADRAALEEKLTSVRSQIEVWTTQLAERQARLAELQARLESFQTRISAAERAVDEAQTNARITEEAYQEARKNREDTEDKLKEAQEKFESGKQKVDLLENERRAINEGRAEKLAEYTRVKTQLEVVEQAEQSLAGYADGARFLLDAARQSKLKRSRGALSAALDVPIEFEAAISAALGDALDAILLDADEVENALQLLESDHEAKRAAVLPLEHRLREPLIKPNDESCLGVASELLNVNLELRAAVRALLGHTLIARDRSSAQRIVRDLPTHARVVTLRGEVFRGDGLIVAGKTASSSALSRPRQKRELTEALAAFDLLIDSLNRDMEALSERLSRAVADLNQMEGAAREARARADEATEFERQTEIEFETARRHLEWRKNQSVQLKAEMDEAAQLQSTLRQSLIGIESGSAHAKEEARTLTLQLSEADLAETQNQAAYWATRVAVAERAREDARARSGERRAEAEKLEARAFELTARLNEAQSSLSALENEKAAQREQEGALQTQIEEFNAQVQPAEQELETAEQEEARLQEEEASAQRALATNERLLGQTQLELLRKQEALENLQQKITDDFGLVMFDYAADVAGPVPLPLEGMIEELPVVTEISPDLETHLTQNRSRMRRMGPINPEAKQEFDSESERYSFMRAQVDDLRKADADLRQVIAELDELTKQSFSKTFDAVDKQFRAMFTRLFGGGSARLALTDPDNLVETGIEIEARLPGRREQGLALLSGGERSLTAVALVFALLKVSPTPVCVMDEVDAMLDEANVGRFRDLLLELSKETQFIVITHNRNTVQVADVIYGITMGRDSASQIISLRLDQVTDEMMKRG